MSSSNALSGQTLFDTLRRTAAKHPGKLAIRQGPESRSYSEFYQVCLQVAGGLQQLGIQPGDRVAILSKNSSAFAVSRYAIAATGAVLVPVNFMLNPQEAAYILNHSGARLLLVGAEEQGKAQALASLCPDIEKMIWLGSEAGLPTPPGMYPFAELTVSTAAQPTHAIRTDDPAQIIYTSGTESAPKGAVLSHAAIIWQYGSCLVDAEIAEADTLLHSMPLYHCAQLDCFLGPSIQVGGSNIITDDPSPENLLALLAAEQITSFFAPPTVWISLLNSPQFEQTDMSRLRKGYYGASIMPIEIMKRIQRSLPQIRLWNLYGQTEIAPVATILKPEDQLRKPGSAGKPVLHVETRIVDDAMRDVAAGDIGEVVHRSPQLLTEYFKDPERTAQAFAGGWFHSGDLATIDDEGYITIVDRKKDMIKTGGENVAGREVEEALYQHADIAEVAVIGLPHPHWIEAVTAVVVLHRGVETGEEAVIRHCASLLAGFKVPKKVLFVDSLPRNPSGKILKRNLRETYSEVFRDESSH
ncbi:MAG: long-chain-fatty-acid--CoA ligase [Halioglobus sp.]|nr:long-chain-fatty-acid--CoA ligase [Halioglobus sp.]